MRRLKCSVWLFFLITYGACLFFSCKKNINPSKTGTDVNTRTPCVVIKPNLLQRKWINTSTVIEQFNSRGSLINAITIYPAGYLDIREDFSYDESDNGISVNGKWKINRDGCSFLLNYGKVDERSFEVVALTDSALTIRRKEGLKAYTQNYKLEPVNSKPCLDKDLNLLTKNWKNTLTVITYYNENGSVSFKEELHPQGVFKVNPDKTYNVFSDGVALNGIWQIDAKDCNLVLDQNTSLERSFEILKLTNDSLVIVRKEYLISYTQSYSIEK